MIKTYLQKIKIVNFALLIGVSFSTFETVNARCDTAKTQNACSSANPSDEYSNCMSTCAERGLQSQYTTCQWSSPLKGEVDRCHFPCNCIVS